MSASRNRRSDHRAAVPGCAVGALADDRPYRYWGFAIIAGCAASWATIFGAAKLLLAVI